MKSSPTVPSPRSRKSFASNVNEIRAHPGRKTGIHFGEMRAYPEQSVTDLVIQEEKIIERILTLELVRVTERAAVSSARLRGRGDEKAADQAAVDAMRRELNRLPIHGTVVIGEGERDEAPMLFIGEEVGTRTGPRVDIAVDPLEGTTLCAKDMPGSIAVMAMAEGGTLLGAPEGVLAAGALRCVGGQMQGRLILDTEAKVERARKMGVKDPKKKYDMRELASGDVIVCATGVTDGALLHGVKFGKEVIETETVIYRSVTGTVRRIHAEHREKAKFRLD